MATDSSPPKSLLPLPSSKFPDNNQALRLDPGARQRKPRSVCKLCLYLSGIVVIIFGCLGIYWLARNVFSAMRNPHARMYHDEKGKGGAETMDWSQVVKPMITKDSKFDVIASVWARDDTLAEGEKDAVVKIDGEERPEKLIFTGKVFKNVDVNSKTKFANVNLRIPTNHFKQSNLSNYDLRASFVLVQSDEDRPPWLYFAKIFTTWKPPSLESPSVRKHDADLTLEDKIYDSFGISIPLIEFHNGTSKRFGNIDNTTLLGEASAVVEDTTQSKTDSEITSWGLELNWDGEETTVPQSSTNNGRNTFRLEFIGGKQPATKYHPYAVTRTHIRVMKQDRLFKRLPYIKALKEVADKICVNSAGKGIQNPEWHECHRTASHNGVFETGVQVQLPPSSADKGTKKWRTEWLYAPYMSAIERIAGPKDIIPIPVDRENFAHAGISSTLIPAEEYITMNWKLTFSSSTQEKFFLEGKINQGYVHNMTETESVLQNVQRQHDVKVGIFGHRIDKDSHPRRIVVLEFIPLVSYFICWLLGIHYWYTRTTTTGISRLGTALLCLGPLVQTSEGLLAFVFYPENWKFSFLDSIPPFVMLVAIMRLEFGWSTEESGRKSWMPRIHMAKATHSERASERKEAKLPTRYKLMLFVTAFAVTHFFITPKSYLLSPVVQLPDVPEKLPLRLFSFQVPTIAKFLQTVGSSSYITGRILQFIMNRSSRTYAGKYKVTILLSLISRMVALLDLLPSLVGTTSRTRGVLVSEGVMLAMAVVDFVQAMKYRNAKSLDGEHEE